MDGDVVTPDSLDGTPQTMQSNNWWDGIGATISDTVNVAQRATAAYTSVRQLASSSSNGNPPPGTLGINPQASTVPGAKAQGAGALSKLSPALLIGLAVVAAILLKRFLK